MVEQDTRNLAHATIALANHRRVIERSMHAAADKDVLTLAHCIWITAYGARFPALANSFGTRLITGDAKLRPIMPAARTKTTLAPRRFLSQLS